MNSQTKLTLEHVQNGFIIRTDPDRPPLVFTDPYVMLDYLISTLGIKGVSIASVVEDTSDELVMKVFGLDGDVPQEDHRGEP